MPGKNSKPSWSEAELQDVASRFAMTGTFASGTAYGSGHIHDTFRVRTRERSSPDYILQRINPVIFKDIPALMENIVRVSEHIRRQVADPNREALTVVPAVAGLPFHRDGEGRCWRCFRFIEHRELGQRPGSPEQAFEAGRLFGRFIVQLADLPGPPLHETIPAFHNVEFHLQKFARILEADPCQRRKRIAAEAAFVLSRAEEMNKILLLGATKRIPLRVTHNDTKFNNVLFDRQGRGLCLIDLDTVMPGYVHYDFGDAMRSGANRAREDEPDLDNVGMDIGVFKAIAGGFMASLAGRLSAEEIRHLGFSARMFAFLIGLRFLSDYVDGDRYFRTGYAEHNLQRARVQFRLLEDMERRAEQMETIVLALAEKGGE
jgi:Ser/Thr protein kinase RdoA (MazF antagonist)